MQNFNNLIFLSCIVSKSLNFYSIKFIFKKILHNLSCSSSLYFFSCKSLMLLVCSTLHTHSVTQVCLKLTHYKNKESPSNDNTFQLIEQRSIFLYAMYRNMFAIPGRKIKKDKEIRGTRQKPTNQYSDGVQQCLRAPIFS